jgi:leucyl aminopeptidase (aminopeptidase T)
MNSPHFEGERGAAALVADYLDAKAGDKILVTADTETDRQAIDAIVRAVHAAGAVPTLFTVPLLPYQGALADPYVSPSLAAVGLAHDIWIDLTFPYLAGSRVYAEVMAAKRLKYYLGGDIGIGGIERLFGAVDLDAQSRLNLALDKIVAAAAGKTVRLTCPLGSDVSFALEKPAYEKPRRALKPGHYLTPSSSTMFPVLESVKGEIVFTAIFHEYYTALGNPLRITVDNTVQAIHGPATHKAALDRALRRAGNGKYGQIIHFTHAVSPTARRTGRSFIEDSRVMGSNAVGMGLPWWIPGGGENHPDGVMSEQSVWVDGQRIVEDGVVVWPPEASELCRQLVPKVPRPLFS